MKRAVLLVLALTSFAAPLIAQEWLALADPITFAPSQPSLLMRSTPIALEDGQSLPTPTAFTRLGTVSLDFLPLAYVTATPRSAATTTSAKATLPLDELSQAPDRIYTGGELGVLYGHSIGSRRGSGDEFSSYIFGTVGNDKFQITAGAAYQESTWRYSHGH